MMKIRCVKNNLLLLPLRFVRTVLLVLRLLTVVALHRSQRHPHTVHVVQAAPKIPVLERVVQRRRLPLRRNPGHQHHRQITEDRYQW